MCRSAEQRSMHDSWFESDMIEWKKKKKAADIAEHYSGQCTTN